MLWQVLPQHHHPNATAASTAPIQKRRSGVCYTSRSGSLPAAAAPTLPAQPRPAQPQRELQARPGAAGGGAGAQPAAVAAAAPLFDPYAPDAVLLNGAQWDEGRGRLPNGAPVVPIVVDPYLSRKLRPHQQVG